MGTASLVYGLISIGFGIFFGFFIVIYIMPNATLELWGRIIVWVGFTVPFLALGGLFLKKFDKDRKTSKME
jgi:hypothetical protein